MIHKKHINMNEDMSLARVIEKIASGGSCVIVGRAADYILRDNKDVVSVFIHAPINYRIKIALEKYGDFFYDGEEHVKKSDERRSHYYNKISGLDWGDKHNYDLCIDSSVGVENTVNVIYEYIKNIKSQ